MYIIVIKIISYALSCASLRSHPFRIVIFARDINVADKQFSHFKRNGEHSDSQQHELGPGPGIGEQEEGGISAQVSKSPIDSHSSFSVIAIDPLSFPFFFIFSDEEAILPEQTPRVGTSRSDSPCDPWVGRRSRKRI